MGKIGAAIPDELHRELAVHRAENRTTNDKVVTKALAEYLGVEQKEEWFSDGEIEEEANENGV